MIVYIAESVSLSGADGKPYVHVVSSTLEVGDDVIAASVAVATKMVVIQAECERLRTLHDCSRSVTKL